MIGVRFGDLTADEVRARAAAGAVAVVPSGCTEQQGPHLPVDFDTWMVTEVAIAAADEARDRHGVDVVVLPTMPFGPTPEHRGFGAGFVDLPRDVQLRVYDAVIDSLAAQGFRTVVLWRGCGGHDLAVLTTTERHGCVVHQPELPYPEIWREHGDRRDEGGHADGFATSIALHLRPSSVRRVLIADPESLPVDWSDPDLDFTRYSRTGVIGRPTVASAELGARLWAEVVRRSAAMIAACAGT